MAYDEKLPISMRITVASELATIVALGGLAGQQP
jgi:hypothetical protein